MWASAPWSQGPVKQGKQINKFNASLIMATVDQVVIFGALIWIAVLMVSYFTNKPELQALDSILGFWLALELIDLALPLGLFMFAGDVWILYEAVVAMK